MKSVKMRSAILTAALLTASFVLSACRGTEPPAGENLSTGEGDTHEVMTGVDVIPEGTVAPETIPEMVTAEEPSSGSFTGASDTIVTLLGDGATVEGSGVTVSGSVVTFTAAGTYLISGTLDNGQLVIDTTDTEKVKLILNGVSVSCADGPAVYVVSAPKKAILYTAEDSINLLSDGSGYVVPDEAQVEGVVYPNACIYACDDLKLDGAGTLQITAHGDKGINTKDDLEIAGGTVLVTAPGVGIRANDSVEMTGGSVTVTTTDGDGLKTSNVETEGSGWIRISGGALYISAVGDAVNAATDLTVTDGTLVLTTLNTDGSALKESSASSSSTPTAPGRFGGFGGMGEGNSNKPDFSAKGLKAGGTLTVSGGKVTLVTLDDGIHSNDTVIIEGGQLYIRAGDDGIHADKVLTISGGNTEVAQSYEGLEALKINILGGTNRVTSTDDGMNASGGTTSGMQPGGPGQGGPGPGGRPGMGGRGTTTSGTIATTTEDTPLLTIAGGFTVVNAGGDGIDSNGNIDMTGGTLLVFGPTNSNNGAIDSGDGGYGMTISGGTLLAVGASGMAETADNNGQAVWTATFRSTVAANTLLGLMDGNGQLICAYQLPKSISSIVFSSPDLVSGQTYTLVQGGTGDADGDGQVDASTYTGYSEVGSLTAN
ncbi:MAG: carbohydrate-binding domain-containing protein [Eubacteriales bacterium]